MTSLINPNTGHEVKTDEQSADFWKAAGYQAADQKPKKAPAKKAASSKSEK